MKYLLSVLAIVLAVTAVTAFFLWPEPETIKEDILVTVNGHSLPRSLLDQKKAQSGYHSKDDKAILDTIIINELLLQEAQRIGIDKEPTFRISVQNYYEQSLIKILIDRQFSETGIEATDQDVDQFISNYGKMFTFTRLPENNSGDSSQEPQQRTILFDDLADSLKLMLGGMKVGDVVTDFYTGNEVVSFRLDSIEPGTAQEPFLGNRESIRKIITNNKRERALTAWIKKLRDQATITNPDKTEKP